MNKFVDLIGQKFHRLFVIEYVGKDKWGQSEWLCRCGCGKEKVVLGYCLTRGATQSCGCWQKEVAKKTKTTHGHKGSRIYRIWRGIITRCTNINDPGYRNYGGRGIKICKRWMEFENFLEDMGEVPIGYQIDRKDNDKGYYKKNCRWVTPKQNSRNTRCNCSIPYRGENKLLIEWSEEIGIPYSTLWKRIFKYEWTIEKALTTPVRRYNKNSPKINNER